MPVISSEVPGADDELFKSDGNSGVSMLVGKVWKTTSPDGSGAELEDWICLLFICLSVCLSEHPSPAVLPGASVGDRCGGTVAVWDGEGQAAYCAVELWVMFFLCL